jgi:hypothetical protein
MEEEDYGLAPAPGSRPQFEDEPNLAGQLAMEHAREAIGHDKKFSYGGGGTWAGSLGEGWLPLAILGGIFLVLAIVGLGVAVGSRESATMYFASVGLISLIVGRLWIIVVAAQRGEILAAVGCFFCDLFALIYAIINFGECKLPLACIGGGLMFCTLLGAVAAG